MISNPGTLREDEPHPAAESALAYLRSLPAGELAMWRESLASCSLAGNRAAEVCGTTLDRLMNNEPVSDRYLLGLAWVIRFNEEEQP